MLNYGFLLFFFLILLIVIFFTKPKFSFPFYILLVLIINLELREYNDEIYTFSSVIFMILYYIRFSISIDKKSLSQYSAVTNILIFYLFFVFIKGAELGLDYKMLIKSFIPLYLQIAMLVMIMYLLKYGSTKILMEFFFIGLNIFLFRNALIVLKEGFGVFHNANVGMACSINLLFLFFYAPYVYGFKYKVTRLLMNFKYIIIVISFIIPFLGMGRGGMIAVVTPVLIYSISNLKKQFSRIIVIITIGLISILLINDYLFDIIPEIYVFKHQGANNLAELFEKTRDIESTISTRIKRWDVLTNEFLNNIFIGGAGFRDKILSDINEGSNAWGAHNYFYAAAAGGGLFLLIPTMLFYIFIIFRTIKSFKQGMQPMKLFGLGLIINVFNNIMTNVYYIGFYWSFPMWISMGMGIYFLTTDRLSEDTN